MMRRFRWAAAAGAIGAMLLIVAPLSSGAHADEPVLAGLTLNGLADGFHMDFGFTTYVLPKILDIGSPHANSTLSSEAGGTARAVAAQVFPGDVVTGAYGEKSPFPPPFPAPGFPGYREANYPGAKETAQYDANDDTNTVAALFNQNIPTTAGPLTFAASHLKTVVSATASEALVTTQGVDLAGVLHIANIETYTKADAQGTLVGQLARSTISDLTLKLAEDVSITIGTISSAANSSSNGETGKAAASLKISDVEVIIAGQHIRATIDNKGVHLVGLSGAIPADIPQSLKQEFGAVLNQTKINITTSDAVEIAEGTGGEASVGGLTITMQTAVPNFFIPDAGAALLEQIYNNDTLGHTYCLKEQEPQQIFTNVPVPLCLTPVQLVPGFGQGAFATLSFGTVRATADAAKPFVLPPIDNGGTTGGFTTGGFVPPIVGGTTGIGTTTGGGTTGGNPPATPPRLFGLAAKLPPGALLGTGAGFLLLAVALAFGPSLRRWRPMEAP
jgi:hypothetical protein